MTHALVRAGAVALGSAVLGGAPVLEAWAHAVHEGSVVTAERAAWIWDPWVVVPLILTAAVYAVGAARLWKRSGTGAGIRSRHVACFVGGWLALAVALVSPIDGLGAVLFSVHMVQHELLMLVAAPLLVLGRPATAGLWALPARWRRPAATPVREVWSSTGAWLTHPLAAASLYAIVLWAWHIPALFHAALYVEWIHNLQHVSFLGAALLFWWMILHHRRGEAGRGAALMALFATGIHGSMLSALLTFSQTVFYTSYLDTAPTVGLTALEDQHLGGLIMWIPAGAVYLVAAVTLMARWLSESETRARRPAVG